MNIHRIVTFVISLVLGSAAAAQHVHPPPANTDASDATTALTAAAVQQLLAGEGMGLAKPAELNRYPGPKHVLELEAPLGLSPEQVQQVETIRQQMLTKAKALGKEIVAAERALDAAFAQGSISDAVLTQRVNAIAALQGELRATHLRAHLATAPVLSGDQVRKYYEHRNSH